MRFRIIMLVFMAFILVACEKNSTSPDAGLQAPTNLTLEQVGWDSIKLTWQDSNDSNTGFRIDRRVGDGEWEINYCILTGNIATYIDTNLVTIANYTYRVFAENQDDSSGFTEASFVFFYQDIYSIASLNESEIILYPLESTEFQVCLKDNNGDLVQREYEIWFRFISMPEGSNINNTLWNTTDSISVQSIDGIASVTLNSGSEEGLIILKPYAFNSQNEMIFAELEASIDFQYPAVADISIISPEQIDLYPLETAEITVQLVDELGENVLEEYEVWFKFMGRPEGTNINETLYETTDSLNVSTTNGQVTVMLNSGELSGQVSLKIFTFNNLGEEIVRTKSNILVRPMEADSIELIYGGINEAEDVISLWRIALNVYVEDIYSNPLPNGTIIHYSILDNPDFAVIQAEVVCIGNINNSEPGFAYNYLVYDGTYTNEPISVNIVVGKISLTEVIVLPLQYPSIDVVMTPPQPDWLWEDYVETASLRIVLQDGQGNFIDNHQLVFEITLGELIDMGSDDDDDPYTEITGIINNEHGLLNKDWIFHLTDCPPPDGDEPGSITGKILIVVQGANLHEMIPITLIRYP